MSRALTLRVRTLLTEKKVPLRRFRGANIEVTARPAGGGRGLTADYEVTVRTAAGDRSFSGSHSAPSEMALRREVIEKAATEIVANFARLP
jgi:hypothetical protein